MPSELTALDRDRAEAILKVIGEPIRKANSYGAPDTWTRLSYDLAFTCKGSRHFLTREDAIDCVATFLRDLRTLLGVEAEVQAAREKDAKLARDMGSDAIAAARAEEAEACIAEYAERFPWSPFRAMAEHAIRARHPKAQAEKGK